MFSGIDRNQVKSVFSFWHFIVMTACSKCEKGSVNPQWINLDVLF